VHVFFLVGKTHTMQKQKRESNVMFWQQKKKGNAGAQKKKELEQNKHHVIDFTEIR